MGDTLRLVQEQQRDLDRLTSAATDQCLCRGCGTAIATYLQHRIPRDRETWPRAALLVVALGCAPSGLPAANRSAAPVTPPGAAYTASPHASTDSSPTSMTTYQNPVLPGTHPDPSVCRVGADFYLAVSSFEYFPGVPIYHSQDLVHWRRIGHALTRDSQLQLAGTRSSSGIFAPTLRYHAGTFYMITTNMKGGGSFYVTARDPAGVWSDPIRIRDAEFTMDPSLFFDDDGKVYYTRHGEGRNGAIFQAEIDIASGVLKAAPQRIWSGTGGIWPEGPHLYKHAGHYYLMTSEGGTSYGHAITIARSRSPWGPFESNPNNPILTHSDQPERPIQATGHGDLVQTPSGAWWMVLLAIRPSTPGYHHIGREVFLAPVEWTPGTWPVVNQGHGIEFRMEGKGLPVSHAWPELPAREEFRGGPLRPEWSYVRNPDRARYSLSEHSNFLRLRGGRVSLDDQASPTLIVQPQTSLRASIATELWFEPQPGQAAGLVIRGNEENHYALLIEGGNTRGPQPPRAQPAQTSGQSTGVRSVVLVTRIAGETVEVGRRSLAAGPVLLLAQGDLDHYEFFFQMPGAERISLGKAPTTPFAYEKTGSFTGAYVGLYAHSNDDAQPALADFAWFEQQAR